MLENPKIGKRRYMTGRESRHPRRFPARFPRDETTLRCRFESCPVRTGAARFSIPQKSKKKYCLEHEKRVDHGGQREADQ
jgi:hypothetical protein